MTLSRLQKKYLSLVSKTNYEEVSSPQKIEGEFWLLSNGVVVSTNRHRTAVEVLKLDRWDDWVRTGAVRGILTGSGLNLNKYAGITLSPDQIESIRVMLLRLSVGEDLYIESTTDEATKSVDYKRVEFEDGRRKFQREALSAVRAVK